MEACIVRMGDEEISPCGNGLLAEAAGSDERFFATTLFGFGIDLLCDFEPREVNIFAPAVFESDEFIIGSQALSLYFGYEERGGGKNRQNFRHLTGPNRRQHHTEYEEVSRSYNRVFYGINILEIPVKKKSMATEKKHNREQPEETGMAGLVLEGALSVVRGWLESAKMSVERTITDTLIRVAQQIFIFFLALLGMAFLLFGVAKILSFFFEMPGMGEIVVGFVVLGLALVLFLFTRKRK